MNNSENKPTNYKPSVFIRALRQTFEKVPEAQNSKKGVPIPDCLSAGLAMFALKFPSLLSFDDYADPVNLKSLYCVDTVPSDTTLRETLDSVNPESLRPAFVRLFQFLKESELLESYKVLGGKLLVALDGTGYFSSSSIHCSRCLESKRNGKVTYSHQCLVGAIVHPSFREPFPLPPEPICKQDGITKNDCENNASKRFLSHFRSCFPDLEVVFLLDALYATAPMIDALRKAQASFLIVAKPGSVPYLFEEAIRANEEGESLSHCITETDGRSNTFLYSESLQLNASNPEVKVNLLQQWESLPDGSILERSWITDLHIEPKDFHFVAECARSRWTIENETFNTLKNQGYHFEHNFGHGLRHLTDVFCNLMLLAFFCDQLMFVLCETAKQARSSRKAKIHLWNALRSLFEVLTFEGLDDLWEALAQGRGRSKPAYGSFDTS